MVKDTNIPAGYKLTEVGVIPGDWEVKTLEEIAEIATGNTPPTNDLNNYGYDYLFVGPADLGRSKYILETVKKLSKKGFNISRKFPQNSILFTCIGSTIGKSGIAPIMLTSNQQINAIFPNDSYSTHFVYYILNYIALRIKSSASEQAVPIINKSTFEAIQFSFPPLPEQQAIAGALSDVDALLTSLEQLIAKKRNIKQGAMQQLLTGKKRLPGFTGEWEVINIIDKSLLKARIGWQGLTTKEYLETGEIYLVTGTDFADGKINWNYCYFVDERRYSQDKNIQLNEQDILITKDGTIGKIAYVDKLPRKATLNSGIFVIRPKKNTYHPLFLFYLLNSEYFNLFLNQLKAGSTITHLYQKDFINFSFLAPPLKEQQAIAGILGDMDKEIEALEKKREKFKAIKQGMMQELLTGKTRLI